MEVMTEERSPRNESIEGQLLKVLDKEGVDQRLAACVAGDREPTPEERENIERLRQAQGDRFYSDLLFAVTHHYFPYEEAKRTWRQILDHKRRLAEQLGRNPGIAVASLDYLTNIRSELPRPGIISEAKMSVMAEAAVKDGLTGLVDRGAFESQLVRALRGLRQPVKETSLIMLDIDDFKQINDSHGHPAGDAVLARIGDLLQDEVRHVDIPARYGGEEFSVLLLETGAEEAAEIAERIRTRVAAEFESEYGLTVSLGVATCPTHGEGVREIIEAADRALYEAKRRGKNMVVVASGRHEAGPR
jgi:diguanylate cyclase (GGDEF)-like protein